MTQAPDQKRMYVAVAISALVLIAWSYLFPPPKPPPPSDNKSADGGVARTVTKAADDPARESTARSPLDEVDFTKVDKRTEALDGGDLHRVEITNHGGGFESWQLLEDQYQDKLADGSTTVPHELVRPFVAGAPVMGFLPPTIDIELGGRVAVGAYERQGDANRTTSTWKWLDRKSNIEVERRFTIDSDAYTVSVDLSLRNVGDTAADYRLGARLMAVQDAEKTGGGLFSPPVYLFSGLCERAESLERRPVDEIRDDIDDPEEPTRFNDGVQWAGVDNRYFLLAAIAEPGTIESCEFEAGVKAAGLDVDNLPSNFDVVVSRIEFGRGEIAAGETVTRSVRFYAGPKKYNIVNSTSPSLGAAVDFGIFAVVCVPMLEVMRAFFNWTGNWGIAIILLTILVKLLTFPLTHKQYKSMAEMKRVQPEMQAIQAKYKEDRTKLQQEMMKLYKEHKINPLAGCLPMFLMMPIYFALYRTIYSAVELYHADFLLWINDLSAADPLYVLPVVLGGLMFVQTRLNPSTGDGAQQKMLMYMMPGMFTLMMLFLPSGLVVYILSNTVMGIAQQYWLMQKNQTTRAVPAKA